MSGFEHAHQLPPALPEPPADAAALPYGHPVAAAMTAHFAMHPPPAYAADALPAPPLDALPSPAPMLPPPPAAAAVTPLAHPSGVVPHALSLPARSSSRVPASQRRTPAAPADKLCNCRNSKCLKLYCECFASGRYCNGCNCLNCLNNKENEAQRSKAIETILERNPNAFRPKIMFQQGDDGGPAVAVTRHAKGCSCRKSNCLKKYCECFQAAIFCSTTCRCKECKNFEGSEHLMAVMENAEGGTTPVATRAPTARAHSKREAPPGGLNGYQDLPKRPRTMARTPSTSGPAVSGGAVAAASAAAAAQYPAVPAKPDPARDAIRATREKKMQEFIAHMLVRLHTEAHTDETKKADNGGDGAVAQPGADPPVGGAAAAGGTRDWPVKDPAALSAYYVATEGTLLSEFGSFIGKMCDRIEAQVAKRSE